MVKHVVTMGEDDFRTIIGAIGAITYEVDHMDESHRKGRLKRYLEEIEDVLGIEPPKIPEAVTAKWQSWGRDQMTQIMLGYCSNCGESTKTLPREYLPDVCPHCKAVMTGVE